MASLRQIRRRLRSIQNTKQIMRAMQLVSGSKFKRSQHRLVEVRGIMDFLDELLQRLLATTVTLAHPLCATREEGQSALVVFTSDTGLCGAYNTNLIQLAESYLRRDSLRTTPLICIGKKGHRYFTKRGYAVTEAYLDLAGRPDMNKVRAIGRALMERFLSGTVSSISLLFSQRVSSMVSRPAIQSWLPIKLSTQHTAPSTQTEYIFEPSVPRVFEDVLPRWAITTFQMAMLEAFASEHSARMIAMQNATENAGQLAEELTLQRNKIRQAAITKELSEIVGTAEALK